MEWIFKDRRIKFYKHVTTFSVKKAVLRNRKKLFFWFFSSAHNEKVASLPKTVPFVFFVLFFLHELLQRATSLKQLVWFFLKRKKENLLRGEFHKNCKQVASHTLVSNLQKKKKKRKCHPLPHPLSLCLSSHSDP